MEDCFDANSYGLWLLVEFRDTKIIKIINMEITREEALKIYVSLAFSTDRAHELGEDISPEFRALQEKVRLFLTAD